MCSARSLSSLPKVAPGNSANICLYIYLEDTERDGYMLSSSEEYLLCANGMERYTFLCVKRMVVCLCG